MKSLKHVFISGLVISILAFIGVLFWATNKHVSLKKKASKSDARNVESKKSSVQKKLKTVPVIKNPLHKTDKYISNPNYTLPIGPESIDKFKSQHSDYLDGF